MLHLLCYLITAISFVFPPSSFLFEDFKVAHCGFVPRLQTVPTWVQEASSIEVCKAPSMKALFQEASAPDVCCWKEGPKALFVLKDPSKEIFVLNKPTFPLPPVCPLPVGTGKPILEMGLLPKEPFCRPSASFFCPVPALSLPAPAAKPALIPTGFFQNLLVVSKRLFWEHSGYLYNRPLTIFVIFLYLTFVRPRIRRRKARCRCWAC